MFLHKNALSQKRSEDRPLGWKNFGECSIRLRWGSQNLGSFLLSPHFFVVIQFIYCNLVPLLKSGEQNFILRFAFYR
ncbi:MAG: hypothetical protein ACJATI_000028 [Halioglobus sp.]|jgi:hypothetical protein